MSLKRGLFITLQRNITAMAPPVSPLAPTSTPTLPPIKGVRLAAYAAGIRYKVRSDLMVAELAPGTTVGGVLTRSLTASAPVEACCVHLKGGSGRVLVVNAGNANTFTGKRGVADVNATCAAAAQVFGCKPAEVFVSSTGTIGVPLPVEKITGVLPAVKDKMSETAWSDAAAAIMTTDTFPKVATRRTVIDGKPVIINGMCKGSGMIAPDMGTMLAYVFTDAALAAPVVQSLIASGADKSFNCMTVDSDTSTSDTLLMFATGQAGNGLITEVSDPKVKDFTAALDDMLIELAKLVAKDGEGASKFMEIRVTGAEHKAGAKRIALSIANSPLVKTAIAGEDANWGRIVMAVGKAGERADRDKLTIAVGGTVITRDGGPVENYDETPVVAHMKGKEILIEVDVGIAGGSAIVWTCDLTHGYIDINGSYRT